MPIFSPFGLNPVNYLNGAPWNGKTRQYSVDQTRNIYTNGPVILSGTASAISNLPTVTNTGGVQQATTPIIGVARGFYWTDASGMQRYTQNWVANTPVLAGTDVVADVIDDTDVAYEIMVAGGASTLALPVAGNIPVASVGLNATFGNLYSFGNNATGISQAILSTDANGGGAAPANTATFPMQIIGLGSTSSYPGNAYGANYTVVLVRLNNHQFKAGTTGV